jgi:hypothetical protein
VRGAKGILLSEKWSEGGVVGVEGLPGLGYEGLRECVEESVLFRVWGYGRDRQLWLVASL